MDFFLRNETDNRIATYLPLHKILPQGGTRQNPDMILYEGTNRRDKVWIRDVCQATLEKMGLPPAEIAKVQEEAEKLYEERMRVQAARLEIRRRLEGQVPRMKKTSDGNGDKTWSQTQGGVLVRNYAQK